MASSCAQTLQIMPVRVDLLHGQMATTVFVTNKGEDRQTVQVRPFHWDQQDGTDRLQPTSLLAVSPPITDIGAGETQVFRVVLRQAAVGMESSFRLLFDELPAPAPPGSVRVALRLSIPVFARPGLPSQRDITWRVIRNDDGALLSGVNRGTDHVRISHALVTQGDGPTLAVPSAGAAYILPGAARTWPIDGGSKLRPGSTVRLTAISDQGPVDASVDVSGP